MRVEYQERAALKKERVEAQKKSQKCQPCHNRSRRCDYDRPQCGTCILRDVRCFYKVSLISAHVQLYRQKLTISLADETSFAPNIEIDAPTADALFVNYTLELQTNAVHAGIVSVPQVGEQGFNNDKKRKRSFFNDDEEKGEQEREQRPKRYIRRRQFLLNSGDEEQEEGEKDEKE